jgi:two-component system, chemotaxis family, response regulator PixG
METSTSNLFYYLKDCAENRFTGELHISGFGATSILSFFQGLVVGDSGGTHPIRRWRRQLSRLHLPKEVEDAFASHDYQKGSYNSVEKLLDDHHVNQQQASSIIQGSLLEVLFDIHRYEELSDIGYGQKLRYLMKETSILMSKGNPLVSVNIDNLYPEVEANWQSWLDQGLAEHSPNLAPKINNAEKLRQMVSENAYRKLTSLIDGKQTLRDLAIQIGQDVMLLTRSLICYHSTGIITLNEITDITPIALETQVQFSSASAEAKTSDIGASDFSANVNDNTSSGERKLIAYIDDSPLDSQTMAQIIKYTGYDYVNVQNPIQALSTLLKYRPSLIFLDLVMPNANGYEICAKLRRVTVFKETPIIILTNSDGLVDRVRAKMVGSTGFVNKPITEAKITEILQKYIIV